VSDNSSVDHVIEALVLPMAEEAILEITGGVVSTMTVTVVCAVTEPPLFVAVKV